MLINLLPEEEKKEFEKEKIWEKIFIILIFLLISLLFLILILFFLRIYIDSKIESSRTVLQKQEEELKGVQFKNLQKIITQTNQSLSKIQKFWQQQILITPIFEKISSLTPNSIYFTRFSFRKIYQGQPYAEISISGLAENREDLFYFRKSLKAEEEFEDVYFSPTSWVEPVNIDFSFSFKFRQ